mmetsp:Transcript_38943/g.81848  ORF Transcript_38943/g.81848 Transcript_38943/m.81848 type:complete len:249 (-) Transcript_38943:14-760(-)
MRVKAARRRGRNSIASVASSISAEMLMDILHQDGSDNNDDYDDNSNNDNNQSQTSRASLTSLSGEIVEDDVSVLDDDHLMMTQLGLHEYHDGDDATNTNTNNHASASRPVRRQSSKNRMPVPTSRRSRQRGSVSSAESISSKFFVNDGRPSLCRITEETSFSSAETTSLVMGVSGDSSRRGSISSRRQKHQMPIPTSRRRRRRELVSSAETTSERVGCRRRSSSCRPSVESIPENLVMKQEITTTVEK